MLQTAATIGRLFGIDPIVVLDESDEFRRAVRIAAARHVVKTENAANRR